MMKKLCIGLCTTVLLYAQSFYVLTGVDSYDPIVANMSAKTEKYSSDIKNLMVETSKELGIDISGHPSRVLAFVIKDVSLGNTVGLKVDLAVGEYVRREGSAQPVFGETYMQSRLIAPDFKDEDDVEDQLADTVEEMLDSFKRQWIADNKRLSKKKRTVTHETFAKVMGYETDYAKAKKKALQAGKPLMVFMTTSYCPWCRKLENRILSQLDIDEKIKQHYVPVMLNLDKDRYPSQLGKTRFTPIIYIVEPGTDKVLHQFTGYSSRGDFLHLLKR